MKRLFALLLALCLVLALCACGSTPGAPADSGTEQPSAEPSAQPEPAGEPDPTAVPETTAEPVPDAGPAEGMLARYIDNAEDYEINLELDDEEDAYYIYDIDCATEFTPVSILGRDVSAFMSFDEFTALGFEEEKPSYIPLIYKDYDDNVYGGSMTFYFRLDGYRIDAKFQSKGDEALGFGPDSDVELITEYLRENGKLIEIELEKDIFDEVEIPSFTFLGTNESSTYRDYINALGTPYYISVSEKEDSNSVFEEFKNNNGDIVYVFYFNGEMRSITINWYVNIW